MPWLKCSADGVQPGAAGNENLGRIASFCTRTRAGFAAESRKVQGRAIMFDHAGRQYDRRQCAVGDSLDTIDAALRNLGFVPPRRYGNERNVVCGTAMRVSVREVLDESEPGRATLERLCELVGSGVPVNLSAEEFGEATSVIAAWQRFCESIHSALSQRGLTTGQLGICVPSHQMPLEAYRLIADAVLGRGPRYVFLDSLQMSPHSNPAVDERAAANWLFLWRQRTANRPVAPAYGGIVRSACPLLADEVAATVLPDGGINAPNCTAWLPITLPMTAFATACGQINWASLTSAIGKALSLAEQLYGQVRWHDEQQQQDSRDNRRLAIVMAELGDIVMRRGDDPTSLACLRWLAGVVTRIRDELRTQSRMIARRDGPLPALEQANHVGQWQAGPQRESWRRHWDTAVRHAALRHRNMLVISPYSVIPSAAPSTVAYGDLLPVLAIADAWCFAGPSEFRGWDASQFRDFHRRARATIQGSHAASFVAAGV